MSGEALPASATQGSSEPSISLKIGTRGSALAIVQAEAFRLLLRTYEPTLQTTIVPVNTALGDRNKVTNLHALASEGKSLWTEELEEELRQGAVDVLVHSLKDVPTKLDMAFVVAAVGPREDAQDAVVMSSTMQAKGHRKLADLPEGAVVGTSSVRRVAMLRRTHPHLVVKDVRGNVGTRLDKLDNPSLGFDALILAAAGLRRMGLGHRVSSLLGVEDGFLHAVGQGALGAEWRADDKRVAGLLKGLSVGEAEARVRLECVAERSLLRALEGGCSVPIGVHCSWATAEAGSESKAENLSRQDVADSGGYEYDNALPTGDSTSKYGGMLTMRALVVSPDGSAAVEGQRTRSVFSDADAEDCAGQLYKDLVERGVEDVLKDIPLNRAMIKAQNNA